MVHVPDIILPPTLVAVVQLSTPVFSIYCSTTLALFILFLDSFANAVRR